MSEDQQSLAIGKGGQNVRLAAKLTGWRIDIQSVKGENLAGAVSEENTNDADSKPTIDLNNDIKNFNEN